MLFKRIIEGKSVLNADSKKKLPEKCSRRKSECDGDGCGEHSTILEEMMKMVLLGVVLWAGVSFGSSIAPYPFNLIVTNGVNHPPPMYDFPFPSAEMFKRIPPVTTAQTNESIEFSKMTVSRLERFEQNLNAAGIVPDVGSAALGLTINGFPSSDAMHYEKSSMIIAEASTNLVWKLCTRFGLPKDECASFVSTLNLRDSEFSAECAALERFTCRTTRMSSRYRTFDGSCTNPVRSSWGQSLTGYKRLLHPRYADGIEEPRRAHNTRRYSLPSARLLSTQLAANLDRPDDKRTIALAVFSQFVYHDLVHTPIRKTIHTNKALRCCATTGNNLLPRHVHPSCMPISVPAGDVNNRNNYDTCMEYVRSVTTYRGDCTFGASEQMNQATHFLDGSQIYGSNIRDAALLRDSSGGLLKTTNIDNKEYLPLAANPTEKCLVNNNSDVCFEAGDVRANLHPWLTSMHSLWLREHNKIARTLATLNPSWNSDQLFHEARRIVVAELQHLTYNYWLPALIGKPIDELYESFDTGFNSEVNPTITNSFATAAFHFVNSLLDQDIEVWDENVTSSHRLADHYYKPGIVSQMGLEGILRGMVVQKSQGLDFNYEYDLHHRWLGGLDVLALDIQRGRDHGLPGYSQYRPLYGMPAATHLQELADLISQQIVDKLSQLYEHHSDIDLVVGGMAETPLPGSMFGPTFTYLIKEQFWRTRAGDRYFYTHSDESGSFTKRQLAEIKRVTLARLLCDNTAATRVQRDVFQPPSDSNPVVSCEEIKKVNLEAWQEAARPDLLTRTTKWIKNKVGNTNTGNNRNINTNNNTI